MRKISCVSCALALAFGVAAETSIAELAWMTGVWRGPSMGGTLEESWNEPRSGSIQALVRAEANGITTMFELIVIEETDAGLTLNIQQWSPGFRPIRPPQKMRQTAIGPRTVTFTDDTTTSGIKQLSYARPEADTFTISVTLANAQQFLLTLKQVGTTAPSK